MYKILKKRILAPDICLMEVSAPRVASSAQPGQFIIVRVGEKGERVPLTICDFDPVSGSVTIVTQRVGASSRKIFALEAVSYTHLRAHETPEHIVCRLLLEKKKYEFK